MPREGALHVSWLAWLMPGVLLARSMLIAGRLEVIYTRHHGMGANCRSPCSPTSTTSISQRFLARLIHPKAYLTGRLLFCRSVGACWTMTGRQRSSHLLTHALVRLWIPGCISCAGRSHQHGGTQREGLPIPCCRHQGCGVTLKPAGFSHFCGIFCQGCCQAWLRDPGGRAHGGTWSLIVCPLLSRTRSRLSALLRPGLGACRRGLSAPPAGHRMDSPWCLRMSWLCCAVQMGRSVP